MSLKARLPQSPRHILVYNDDWEYLETRFGYRGLKPVGVSNVIRALIHKRVLEWREAENDAATLALRARVADAQVAAEAATTPNTQEPNSDHTTHPTDLSSPPRSHPG